nr:dna damage-binding protein cmr1 [Quercus suber]
MVSSQKLTDYEQKCLDNIRRNQEIVAALKIHSKATELSSAASSKRQRVVTKSFKASSEEKRPKTQTTIEIRSNATMIVVGNNFGNVGFWDVDSEDDDRLYLYHPRAGTISGISMHQHYFEKIFTSCDLGSIRLMDVEKEIFDLVYSSEDPICSLSQRSDDVKCLYFSEGCGRLNIWDERVRKCSTQSKLHAHRINSIDFNSQNYNIMATSSSDGTVTIWDLRSIKELIFNCLHVAWNDTVGIVTGVKFEHTSMINHNNQTRNWTSSFRAIWGWDDSYIFIGNMERGVDVISPTQKGTIFTLQSPHMSAVPSRLMHTLTMLACLQEPQIRARAIWGWDDSYIFIGNMERGVDVISPIQKGTIFTLQSPHMSAVPSRLMHTLTMLACLQEPQIRARFICGH